jgi:hypothetical protein
VRFALLIYVIGVVIGLIGTDARALPRVCLALLWPVGALAFVVTVGGLLAVSTILFPSFGVAVLSAALLGWILAG